MLTLLKNVYETVRYKEFLKKDITKMCFVLLSVSNHMTLRLPTDVLEPRMATRSQMFPFLGRF